MRSFPYRTPACRLSRIRSTTRGPLAAVAATACLLTPSTAPALTVIGNGDSPPNPTNVIDENDPPDEDYRIEPCLAVDLGTGCLAPPLPTSAESIEGADVHFVEAVGDSHLDVLGGDILQITLEDTSSLLLDAAVPVTALDPFNQVGWIRAFDDASIVVQEGLVSAITLAGNSTLTHLGMIDGIVEVTERASMLLQGRPEAMGLDSGVFLSGSGSLFMESGWITDNGLQAGGNSTVTMIGGTVNISGVRLFDQARMHWSGGNIAQLDLFDTSVMTIAGDSFAIDGMSVNLGAVVATSGVLTGTLANGDPLSVPFDRNALAHLVLVPEPATFVSLGLGLLVLLGASRCHLAG